MLSLMFVVLLMTSSSSQTVGRDRRCCLYQDSFPTAHCSKANECVFVDDNDDAVVKQEVDDEDYSCQVLSDSKAESRNESNCTFGFDTHANYDSKLSKVIRLKHYSFFDSSLSKTLVGIDARFNLDHSQTFFTDLYLKITNEECVEDELCVDRCVHIHLDKDIKLDNHIDVHFHDNKELSYDCELGFFTSKEGGHVMVTSGNLYRLDVCMKSKDDDVKCAAYNFLMPHSMNDVNQEIDDDNVSSNDNIGLLDIHALNSGRLLLHNIDKTKFDSVILEQADDSDEVITLLVDTNEGESDDKSLKVASVPSSLSSLPGRHKVVLVNSNTSETMDVAFITFYSPSSSSSTDIFVYLLIFFILLLLSVSFALYRQYERVKRNNIVEPNRLLASGRITAKTVVIITNVDNRQHVEVVRVFINYLKNYCGVGKVFFALDPDTGIASHPDQDPWKWARQVSEELMDQSDTILVFIGAPSTSGTIPVHPQLPNNQAFVTTHYLAKMVREKRVVVLHFSYSDAHSIPNVLPVHVRSQSLFIPQDMNVFLCQLLEVRKRDLCLCLPIPLVEPKVAPSDLSSFEGGLDLLSLISKLEMEPDSAVRKASVNLNGCNLSGLTFDLPFNVKQPIVMSHEGEKKRLLLSKHGNNSSMNNHQGLAVEVEPHVLSLKDDQVSFGDRNVCPEFRLENNSCDGEESKTMTTTTTTTILP